MDEPSSYVKHWLRKSENRIASSDNQSDSSQTLVASPIPSPSLSNQNSELHARIDFVSFFSTISNVLSITETFSIRCIIGF